MSDPLGVLQCMAVDRKALTQRAETQDGLLARRDLEALGLTPRQRRTVVGDGTLQILGRQTFAIAGLAMTDQRRVRAACLETDGRASHEAGAWLHGLDRVKPGLPPPVTVRRPGHEYRLELAEVHTTSWLPSDDITSVNGIPCLSVARTLFSLAGAVSINDPSGIERLAALVDEAVRDGKAPEKWLWWVLGHVRRRGRAGVRVFEQILEQRAHGMATESWLEREFLRLLRNAGVPLPRCQIRIERDGAFVGRVDFSYEPERVAIEVSGHAHHSTRSQTAADARRRNQLQLAGYQVLEFTYDDVVRRPDAVVAQVIDALSLRARMPRVENRRVS